MKNSLRSLGLVAGLFAGVFGSNSCAGVASFAEHAVMTEKAFVSDLSDAVFTRIAGLNTPVFQFKTTGKDPYAIIHSPSSNVLDSITFGYYPGNGHEVFRITKPEHISHLIPIRRTQLFNDGGVKIDEKYPGFAESFIGVWARDIFATTGLMPDKYFKGTMFVDQYLESVPSKWTLRSIADFNALRKYLQPLFEQHKILEKNLPKSLLVLEFENSQIKLSAEDNAWLSQYYEFCDLTDPVVQAFFNKHQKEIFEEIGRLGDAKYVKESLFEILFRNVEKVGLEFKGKEVGAAVLFTIITAVSIEIAKAYVKDATSSVKSKLEEKTGLSLLPAKKK